jgi:hypothetical protein
MKIIRFMVGVLFIGLAMGARPSQADSAYFVKFSYNPAFLPLLVSGDGQVIIGEGPRGTSLAAWTKTGGVKIIAPAPPGYTLLPKAVDEDGNVIVGVMQPRNAMPMTDRGAMFRWSARSGLQLLTANTPGMDGVWQMDVSNDGQSVEFFCPDQSAIPTCPGSGSAPANWPATAREWTQGKGIQILGDNIAQHFDFIMTTGDFDSYVISVTGPVVTNWSNQTQTAPFSLGIVDRTGRYIPFKNVPKLVVNFGGANGTTIKPMDRMADVTMNRAMTLIAVGGVWDNLGAKVHLPKTSSKCNGFSPMKITNTEEFFGAASCPPMSGFPELHLSAAGSQTIGDWLRQHGVPNDLGDSNTAVISISDDGKTILGYGNEGSVNISRLGPSQHALIWLASDTVPAAPIGSPYTYIAHLP